MLSFKRASVWIVTFCAVLISCQWLDVRQATINNTNKSEVIERARKSGKLSADELRQLEAAVSHPHLQARLNGEGMTVSRAILAYRSIEQVEDAARRAREQRQRDAELQNSIRVTVVRLETTRGALSEMELLYENVADRPIAKFRGDLVFLFEGDLAPTGPVGRRLPKYELTIEEPAEIASSESMFASFGSAGEKPQARDPFRPLAPGGRQQVVRLRDSGGYGGTPAEWPSDIFTAAVLERRGVKVVWRPSFVEFVTTGK